MAYCEEWAAMPEDDEHCCPVCGVPISCGLEYCGASCQWVDEGQDDREIAAEINGLGLALMVGALVQKAAWDVPLHMNPFGWLGLACVAGWITKEAIR
jgi:predicted nucleic acid-binding Zn ribbon protein